MQSIEDAFWSHVTKGDGCWEWAGPKNGHGYGAVPANEGGKTSAHRMSWMLTNGPIPAGMFVCHHCDNPPCVRPDHLFIGTASDNMADAGRKGRIKGGLGGTGRVKKPYHGKFIVPEDIRPLEDVSREYVEGVIAKHGANSPDYIIAMCLGISPTTLGRMRRKWANGESTIRDRR